MREPDSDPAGQPGDGFERIAPVSLNVAPAAPTRVVEGATVSTRTLLIGVALIVLLAVALLFGLPALLDASGPATTSAPVVAEAPPAEAPV